MSLRHHIVAQFRHPHGALGRLAGLVMATRPSNRARNLWTVELMQIAPSDRILEIGCGPGLGLAAAAAKAVDGRLIGIDHSEIMIEQASRRNRRAIESSRMQLLVGGLERLTELGVALDRIFSVNLVQFLPDKHAFYRKLILALRPGGLIATTYMPRHPGATRQDALKSAEEIDRYMRLAGFVDVRTEELPLKPVPAICVLGNRPNPPTDKP